jgi:Mobilization protein NikA
VSLTPRFTLRVPDDEITQWRAEASRAGMSVSEWVRACCRGAVPSPRPTAAEARERIDTRPQTVEESVDELGIPVDTTCRHPRSDRDVKAYGTWCRACGERIR